MKKLIIVLSLLAGITASGQTPQLNATWFRFRMVTIDSFLALPKDTVRIPVLFAGPSKAVFKNYPYIASKNDTLYIWSNVANKWIKPYNKTFDSSLANSNVKLLANRTIKGNNKDFLIDSTNSIILKNGLYGSRLSMLPTYAELAYYGATGTSEVTVSPLQIQLYATNRIVFNSQVGGYGFTNLPKQPYTPAWNILLSDTASGDISQTSAADLFKNGAIAFKRTVVTSDATLDETHYYVAVDCTSGGITVTLPSAATCTGRVYFIKKIDASSTNHVTIAPDGSETIEGITPLYLGTQWQYVWIMAGSTGWEIMGALD